MEKYEKPKLMEIDFVLEDVLRVSSEITFDENNSFGDEFVDERL